MMHTPEDQTPDDADNDDIGAEILLADLMEQRPNGGSGKANRAEVSDTEISELDTQTDHEPEMDWKKTSALVFDHSEVGQQLRLLSVEQGDTTHLASDEVARFNKLCWLTERSARKPLLFGTQQMREQLDELRRTSPAFVAVTNLVDRAIALSLLAEAPLVIPPLLLFGPPGVGKTHYTKALAAVLGVPVHAWSCATNSDAMQLITGHPTSWRGARMGLLTEALVTSSSASPVFLLDEVDKFLTHRDEQPYNILLNVLEGENAAALLDEYLRVQFDVSHAIFIATANEVAALPDFIRNRFLIIPIAAPVGDALIAVTRQIAAKIVTPLGLPMPGEAVLAVLARRNPRRIGRVLRLALGFAAAQGRKVLEPADIRAADALASREESPAKIGFMRPNAEGESDRK